MFIDQLICHFDIYYHLTVKQTCTYDKDIIRHSDREILKGSWAKKGDIFFPQSPATILKVFSR